MKSVDLRHSLKKKILIADDSIEILRIWEIFLGSSRVSYVTTTNGFEASKAFMEDDYGAVFLDIDMPEMDGIEAAKFIKNVDPNVPVIAVTALNSKDDLQKMDEAGFDAHLCKPVNMFEALGKIEALVSQK